MRKGMIANFVTFVHDATQQVGVRLSVLANHEERSRHILLFEYVQNCRRPVRIGSVIETQGDRSRMISGALNHV